MNCIIKKLLCVYLLFILCGISIVNVIAESNVLVEKERSDINETIVIAYSDTENSKLKTDIKKYKPYDSNDIQNFYLSYSQSEGYFFKNFTKNNGSFFVQVSVFAGGQDCGKLIVYRHTINIQLLKYHFFPSLNRENFLCKNLGFKLEIGDATNFEFITKKIPCLSEKTNGYFEKKIKDQRNEMINAYEALCNIILYKDDG